MRKHVYLLLVLLFGVLLFACSSNEIIEQVEKEKEPDIVDDIKEDEPVEDEEILPEEIAINNWVREITVGEEVNLEVKLLPDDATNKDIKYSSSDEDVLVIINGIIKGISPGVAKVRIEAVSNSSANLSFDVIVKEKAKETLEVSDDEVTLHVGDTYKIEYEVTNTTSKAEFYSKDLDYISLDRNGLVTAFEVGKATVTVTLGDIKKDIVFNIIEREKTSEEIIDEVIKGIKIPDVTSEDIELPDIVDGVLIDWTSSNRAVLSDKGEVYYTENIVLVKLYATFTHGDEDVDKTYVINVKPWSVERRIQEVFDSIEIESVVSSNLTLATEYKYGVKAEWESSRSDVISPSGEVSFKENEIDVILKVKLFVGESNMEKKFTVKTIATKKMNLHYFVERAEEFNAKTMHGLELKDGKIVLEEGEVYGYYDSAIYETLKFKELVGSWAAITGKNATCELLVKVRVGKSWSKYFTYGIWGLGRNNLYYNQNDVMAKMDTDEILVPTNDGCAYQYRIILRRDNVEVESPVLSLVAITMRLTDESYTYDVDTSKLPTFVDYDVPKVNQNVVPEIGSVICSATTSTMLLKWKGLDFSDKDEYENRYIAGLVADRGHNNPTYGNWVYNTATIAAFGFDSYVRHMVSWEELKWHLANVGPVGASVKGNIGGVYDTGGHLLVVRGYREVDGQTIVIINDPNINSRFGNDKNGNPLFVYYEFTLSQFMSFWRKTAYIIE